MKKVIFLVVIVLLNCYIGALPRGNPCYSRIFIPVYWKVKENAVCPRGYVCRYDMWVPSITVQYPVWVFGVSNQEECGGIIHFRKYPDEPCTKNCVQDVPVLYTAEVMYVSPYEQPVYTPEEVPLTYIPPGEYIVTSPDFVMYHNIRIWHFTDEGGPKKMHVDFKADKPKYGREDATAVLTVEVMNDSKEYIEVDSISGVIILPDCTQKKVNPEDWSWNKNDLYEYFWDFTNDEGKCANPKEGFYTAKVCVKKKYYLDVTVACHFDVCYHLEIDLNLKDPPEYLVEEKVEIMVHVKDENDEPVNSGVESVLTLPDGSHITDLEWVLVKDGIYTTAYTPQQQGEYTIMVKPNEDIICYLGEDSGTFYVGHMGEGEFSCSLSEEEISNLAQQYAPYMYFYKGFWGEEKYFPTYVEVMLQNSTFWEFGPDKSTKVGGYDSSAEFIGGYTDPDHYLDLNYETCTIDSGLVGEQGKITMYYRVVCHRYSGKKYIIIQYRPFYIFNDFLNNHEGDWEMVEILLDYYTKEPIGAAYSRHLDGEYRLWDDIEKKGTHPAVYIALGSHAAYFEEGIYHILGPLFDVTSDNGWHGLPSDYCLISETRGPPWVYFGGNWGYRIRGDEEGCLFWFDGPRGPLYLRETWLDPVGWALSHYNNKCEILHSPYTLFSLSCPADMVITNSADQRLGFVNGEFVQEIPHSYVQNLGEKEAYIITGIDEYTIEVFGTGDGVFDLLCSVTVWDTTKTIKYGNVPVTSTTKAFLDLGSDLLHVDANQDGITDFVTSPVSIQLSSPQSINPLKIGGKMTYEVVLTNQGNPSTFVLDVDTPLNWLYSLSSNTITVNPGESATILLVVTSPEDIPLKDYTIRVEATSLTDSQMTASLDVIASSKSELVAEDMTAYCEEDITLTAFVSNKGLLSAENVKVQFFNGPPSGTNVLGEKIIDVPSGESVAPSIRCTLPDGLYTFYVVIDQDNSISESCEFNNERSAKYLLDRTPPEAELFFDPESEDLAVRGVDNLDSSVDGCITETIIKNKNIRTYTFTDDAGNTTELHLEIKQNRHEIKAEIIDMKYNGHSVALPQNSLKIEYVIKNGEVKMLNQYLVIGDTNVHLIYNQNRDQTQVINGTQQTEKGLVLVVIRTNKGNLHYSVKIR